MDTQTLGIRLANSQQLLEHLLINLPRPVLVGIGQSRARGRSINSQVAQFSFAGGQSADDFSQRARSSQMAKQEGYELAPAGHPLGVLFALMMSDRGVKDSLGKEL